MFDNPIENIMTQTMSNLKNLVDVNNVIGKPVLSADGVYTIIPISKLSMGFLVGGGEYSENGKNADYPYAGGSGAGISVTPVGFLVCNGLTHKLIKLSEESSKLSDLLSAIINSVSD